MDYIEVPKTLHSELVWVTNGAVATSGGHADLSLYSQSIHIKRSVQLSQIFLSPQDAMALDFYLKIQKENTQYLDKFREWGYMAQKNWSIDTST